MLTKGLRVVALISGGKDSCYNMIQCVSEGHTIVALANLRPKDKDEADSYMFQTVGHHLIDLYGQAMGVPLYRRTLEGSSVDQGADYSITKEDEVEDLYELLREIKEKEDVNAVSVGAILSDYQRVRVENVCLRLGLTPLAYLWCRDQTELMAEMVTAGVNAIIIKVAALGLDPHKHIGKSLAQIYPHMLTMKEKFGLNVCGEGGEYETFTLDCPLFKKRIVIDKQELIMHSDDPIAPVGYLNLLEAHLEDKESAELSRSVDQLEILKSSHLMSELFPEGRPPDQSNTCLSGDICDTTFTDQLSLPPDSYIQVHRQASGHFWITGVMGWVCEDQTIKVMTANAMTSLSDRLKSLNVKFKDLVLMCLYVRNMDEFAAINEVYKEYFSLNPPARICVQMTLPTNVGLRIACYGYKAPGGVDEVLTRRTMHVQGLSHWAPANIGPYSQAVKLGETVYVAGQIGMVPANLDLAHGFTAQCRLSLRHVGRVLSAISPTTRLHHVLIGVCYLTHPHQLDTAMAEFQQALKESYTEEEEEEHDLVTCQPTPTIEYVVVPTLPKQALVEWQVYTADCEGIYSGKLLRSSGHLEATLHYKYLPDRYDLLSYALEIDFTEPATLHRNTKTYQNGFRLAHDVLRCACDTVCGQSGTEPFTILRSVQIFYTRGTASEDQLRQDFQSLGPSPDHLPSAAFIPVESLVIEKRLMTWCS